MRTKRRLRSGAVVLVAISIAACLGVENLSSTSQLTIVASHNPVVVGSAMVGSSVTSAAITLSPQGPTHDDTITSITESCSNFSLNLPGNGSGIRVYCPGGSGTGTGSEMPLPAAPNCTPVTYDFTATFTPSGPGLSSCPVTVEYTSSGGGATSLVIQLQGTGVAPMFALTVSPSSVNFGDHPLGTTSSPTTVVLTNTGSSSLTVNGSNSNSANFLTSGNFASQTIGAGSSASFTVSCQPQAVGAISGTLSLSSAAPVKGVALSCTGIGMSSLGISPVPVTFGSTLVGAPAPDVPITIRNDGTLSTTLTVTLVASNPDLTFAPSGNPNGQTLGAGSATQAIVRYAASTPQRSGQIGSVTIDYTGGSPRAIPINAEALEGEIGTTPAVVDFGPVCVNDTATTQVMVYASGPGDVQLQGIAAGRPQFTVVPMTGTLVANHGNILAQTVTISPAAAGELDDTLTLSTNIPSSPMHTLMMRATALPEGVTPTPSEVQFGSTQVDVTSSAKEVVLSNCGQAPITLTAVRLEGPDASSFTIVSPADPTGLTLAQRDAVPFLVVMNARTAGAKQATLVFEHVGGRSESKIFGFSFGTDGETGARETYYACSTGTAGGLAWPVVLALVVLRRRRRRTTA